MQILLVKGKHVLTMDRENRIITDGAVAIDGSKILDAGPAKEIERSYKADDTIDAKNCIVMPGLISAHNHMYGILSHGIPMPRTPSTFKEFLENFWWPRVENALNKNQIHGGAIMSSVEMVKTGTTCCADVLEAPNSIPGALNVEAKATEAVGVRSILSFEASERISKQNGWKSVQENLNFIRKKNEDKNSLTKGMLCTHTTFTCSSDFLERVRDLASKHSAGIHIHLEEGAHESRFCLKKYGMLPVQFYKKIGFLGPDVLASQCVHTTTQEAKILQENRTRVAHMPLSNCEVGGGIAPVPSFLKQGLTVGLGTDGFIQDMFEVMRAAFLIHKGHLQDASVMPADTVIRMSTIESAKAIGMEDKIGSIAPGKKADLITVNLGAPTPVTRRNLKTHLVVFGKGDMVQDVIIDGRQIMRNRQVLTVDEDAARGKCREAAEDLWRS